MTKRVEPLKPFQQFSGGNIARIALVSWLLFLNLLRASAQVDESASKTLPASADLRPVLDQFGLTTSQQGARGTCSVFTMRNALEFAVAKRQDHGVRLSVEFLNWAANKANGNNKDGGFFSEMWRGFSTYGICTDAELPYQAKFDPALTPPLAAMADAKSRMALGLRLHWIKEWDVRTGLTDAHIGAIKETISNGWPVAGGFRWPKNANWIDGVLQWCGSNDVFDGHSVLLAGYRDDASQPGGGVFIFRNSAGGKDGRMPYAYARDYMNDAVWIDFDERAKKLSGTGFGASTMVEPRDSFGLLTPDYLIRNQAVFKYAGSSRSMGKSGG